MEFLDSLLESRPNQKEGDNLSSESIPQQAQCYICLQNLQKLGSADVVLPARLDEEPRTPLLEDKVALISESWSTCMVFGLGLVGLPAVLEDLSLGTGRALTGFGIKRP